MYYDLTDGARSGSLPAPPEVPDSNTLVAPGQSRAPDELTGLETEGGGDPGAPDSPGAPSMPSNLDTFILRHLFTFKGEYDGTSVVDWTQKVDLLRRLAKAPDQALLPLLLLRVDPRVVPFLDSLKDRLGSDQYTWENETFDTSSSPPSTARRTRTSSVCVVS